MAKWQFHFTKASSNTSSISFRGARRSGHVRWLSGSKLPRDVSRYLVLDQVKKNKWVCGDVKSLAEFKAQAREHEPPIQWHRCLDGIMGTVEVPAPSVYEETNILADRKALRRLELIIEAVSDSYDSTKGSAGICGVRSYGFSVSSDEIGLGICEITLAGRNSLFVEIDGQMIFALGTGSRRCEAECNFLRKECWKPGIGFSLWCGCGGDGYECYFYERIIIPMVLRNGKLDKLATAREVIKAADNYCDDFESRMDLVTERLEAYRGRLESRKSVARR